MQNFSVSIETILFICTSFITISSVVKILKNSSAIKNSKKIEEHDKSIEILMSSNRLNLKASIAMLRHMRTGNGIEDLKEIEEDIQNFLIEK